MKKIGKKSFGFGKKKFGCNTDTEIGPWFRFLLLKPNFSLTLLLESIAFSFIFLFLLTLGPPLPKALCCFSMLEMHGDVYIFGGRYSIDNHKRSIYQLSCSSGLCRWSILNQQLKVARGYLVAIPVPDSFCTS